MEDKIVISASRTRDLVRCSPALLAGILAGKVPVRFSLRPELKYLNLEDIGCLVLWTKNPANMLDNDNLRNILTSYINNSGTIVLNLTVTGLGGTILEPGIEAEDKILKETKRMVDAGLVIPKAIILRYDPLIRVRFGKGRTSGNFSQKVVEKVVKGFSSIGVERLKTSLVDLGYPHIPIRLRKLGIEPDIPARPKVLDFINNMKKMCTLYNIRFDICCHPHELVDEETRGCIDGKQINELIKNKGSSWRVTESLHNHIGKQRKTCMCTYSRDIGHTPGVISCFKSGGACLYCYSQRNKNGCIIERVNTLLHSSTFSNKEFKNVR